MTKIKDVRVDTINASVTMQEYVVVEGVEYFGDTVETMEYHNSTADRERLTAEQPEAIVNGILAVWGDDATVIDPEE